jgi:protein-disulfide isomerase
VKNAVVKILALLMFAGAALAAAPREKVFPDDRTLGDPKAPVVMVEYLAPMCPHCANFAANIFPELKKTYIDTGKVFYVIRIFPLGAPDGAVAGMAKCQKPERYYDFLELAFKKQAMWDPDGYQIPDVEAALIQLGGMAGLKPEDAKRCMRDDAEVDRINRIAQDGIERHKIEAVPSVVLDGQVLLGGEASLPVLKTKIDALLAEAAPPPAKAKLVKHKKHKAHAKNAKKK